MAVTCMDSPVGPLTIVADCRGVMSICFGEKAGIHEDGHPVLRQAVRELREYFEKKRKHFDVPVVLEGTAFQVAVWSQLKKIPFGETRSYTDIAAAIGRDKAVRAVGQANRKNKIPIIIPCHRVIGKDRSLTGYAGSQLDKKEILLALEGYEF
ncbi:methylated-DNA--[protein]-cysteine S-methyltransferase [Weizmannia acidiproducens]|uniref:methylated-DNA--[protein]-cysteine S-methyltransferase n=1 Tax=Heyndrickxia acidiproducens TaxID=1121084 RepID=UPI00038154B6